MSCSVSETQKQGDAREGAVGDGMCPIGLQNCTCMHGVTHAPSHTTTRASMFATSRVFMCTCPRTSTLCTLRADLIPTIGLGLGVENLSLTLSPGASLLPSLTRWTTRRAAWMCTTAMAGVARGSPTPRRQAAPRRGRGACWCAPRPPIGCPPATSCAHGECVHVLDRSRGLCLSLCMWSMHSFLYHRSFMSCTHCVHCAGEKGTKGEERG